MCGIGMEIRYPYRAHIAMVVSRPRQKRISRSAGPHGPVGAPHYGLPGLLRWTGPRCPVGAAQYGLPGLLLWTGPRGPAGAPQYGLPGLLRSTCPRGSIGAPLYGLPGLLRRSGPPGGLLGGPILAARSAPCSTDAPGPSHGPCCAPSYWVPELCQCSRSGPSSHTPDTRHSLHTPAHSPWPPETRPSYARLRSTADHLGL